jgi:hypothetical protein
MSTLNSVAAALLPVGRWLWGIVREPSTWASVSAVSGTLAAAGNPAAARVAEWSDTLAGLLSGAAGSDTTVAVAIGAGLLGAVLRERGRLTPEQVAKALAVLQAEGKYAAFKQSVG